MHDVVLFAWNQAEQAEQAEEPPVKAIVVIDIPVNDCTIGPRRICGLGYDRHGNSP